MSELLSSIQRAQDLLSDGDRAGISRLLDVVRDHAVSAETLIAAQTKSMTEMHLKNKELTERLAYWEKRARSSEAEEKDETLQNLLAYGLHENLHGSDQDA